MDLILLQPGDPEVFGGANSSGNGGSLIDNTWRDSVPEPGQCIELVSLHQGMKQQITTDAIISEIQLQTHPDDMPTEQFKLSFTEILWTYSAQTADIKTAGKVSAGWSIARNHPITQFAD